jgi:ribA/ribD-fused uncharacterized protein
MEIIMNTDEKFFDSDERNAIYFKSNYPSQWFLSSFELYDNEEHKSFTYNCCEQRMMHKKALFFGDNETAELVLQASEPSEQKKLGRLVKNFDVDKWNEVADQIVEEANYSKFSQNPELKQLLINSGTKKYVECAPYDPIWGIGLNITDALNTPESDWKGTNRLGKAIMRARERILSEL